MSATLIYALLAAVTCVATAIHCARNPSVLGGVALGGVVFVALAFLFRWVGPWPQTQVSQFVLLQTSGLYYPLFAYAVGLGLFGGAGVHFLAQVLRRRH